MSDETTEKTELQLAWEERQQDSRDAMQIATKVKSSAQQAAINNILGAALTFGVILTAKSPQMLFFAPPALLVAQTLFSRFQSQSLRAKFNEASSNISAGARQALRDIDVLIPNRGGFTADDFNAQKNPWRVWGSVGLAVASHFLLGLPLLYAAAAGATFGAANLVSGEFKSKRKLALTAAAVEKRHNHIQSWDMD